MNQLTTHVSPIGAPDSTRSSPLRKLLRCKRTGAYLAKGGAWTHDIRKALTLSQPAAPEGFSDGSKADEFEIYYSFDDSRESQYDFTLSLRLRLMPPSTSSPPVT